jgi:hypothetical protein
VLEVTIFLIGIAVVGVIVFGLWAINVITDMWSH